jgi:hypothetical protein
MAKKCVGCDKSIISNDQNKKWRQVLQRLTKRNASSKNTFFGDGFFKNPMRYQFKNSVNLCLPGKMLV